MQKKQIEVVHCMCDSVRRIRVISGEKVISERFFKIERDAPAVITFGSLFHHQRTPNENSLDCNCLLWRGNMARLGSLEESSRRERAKA